MLNVQDSMMGVRGKRPSEVGGDYKEEQPFYSSLLSRERLKGNGPVRCNLDKNRKADCDSQPYYFFGGGGWI
jgi:hypothetical protein